ncbi:radical SAM protein [[Clostridium] polysaccharolyticum]|uniref:Radical SAM superfamily enzyme YgiQ, UPF0313 family n=1 Tax=[Clostridium] polysaccharolyticum TaxID=29364 RepID=A0A1I0DR78_9FIRM|nr:radical SAM protein [[Clostridium] polysaccharolyticum]SET34772.1 Radical SAM superfamily enzyme YgiQ, UPF0313 family [[Clostridium] polysaccharolyticum]
MKKVLFFHCSRYNELTPVITMGLWGLADIAAHMGYDVKIIHTGIEERKNGRFAIEDYLEEDIVLIGFSAHWFPMTKESIDLALEAKKNCPQAFIYMGGFSASFFAKQILEKYDFIDGIMRGDSEMPLKCLLKSIENDKKDIGSIPNLCWRNGDIIVENAFSYVSKPEDLRDIDYATYDKYMFDYEYAKNSVEMSLKYADFADFAITDYEYGKTFYLLTGKGCYAQCLFCGGGISAQKMISNREKCLFLDDNHIMKTVYDAQKLGYRTFYICFDPLPQNPKYLSYLRRMAEAKLDIDLFFGFWQLPTLEIIDEFKKVTNNLLFELSPETNSDRIRDKVRGYSFKNEEMYKVIQKCYDEQIYVHIYFSYPLPYEQSEEVRSTRKAFWQLNTQYVHYIEAFYIKLSTDPASPLYCLPEKYGCKLIAKSLEEHLEECYKSCNGNIMVHSAGEDAAREQYQYILFDNNIKAVFKYNIKIVITAFKNVDEFVDYLDEFYKECLSKEVYLQFHTGSDIIDYLITYTERSSVVCSEWLIEFYKYVLYLANNKLKKMELVSSNIQEEKSDDIYTLGEGVEVFQVTYNFYEVCEKLIDKELVPVEKLPEAKFYLFFSGESFEINESFYDLLTAYKSNTYDSMKSVCSAVAELYTDQEEEHNYITQDLMRISSIIKEQKILK